MIAGITEKEQKIIERILDKYRKDYAFFYYGSRVKGTYEKTSDLDVLIKGKAEMPLAVLQEIKEEFDKSDLPYIVNFSDYYKLDSSFYERIKPDLIPYNWQEVKLGDVCDVLNGRAYKQSELLNTGKYPVLRVGNFFSRDKWYYSNLELEESKYCNNGDLLFAWSASFGPKIWNNGKVIYHYHIWKLQPNLAILDKLYLFYWLKESTSLLTQGIHGSVMAHLTKSDMEKMLISLPPLDVQKKIAGVLGALDDKIELNNKINQNLEAQAQALFKSWFVDFEPFGGQMPDDWKIGKIEDIIDLYDSQRIPLSSNQRANMKKVYPYYGATSVMDFVDNYIFDGKYLLLGEDGTVIDDKGFPILQYVWGKFWVNNHAHIMTGKNGFNVESLYLFFKQTNVKRIVTGAVQPKINQANLKMLPVNIPSNAVMNNFKKIIEPLFSLFRINTEENKRLTELRDALLPKLMSGEINVDDVKID